MAREDQNYAYIKSVRDRVDVLQKRIDKLEEERILLEREQSELLAGQSPIKPGDIIEWERKDGRMLVGRVIRTHYSDYRGFEYRCHILSVRNGKEIGCSNVEQEQHPALKFLTPEEYKKFNPKKKAAKNAANSKAKKASH